jgi:hypothetical protein
MAALAVTWAALLVAALASGIGLGYWWGREDRPPALPGRWLPAESNPYPARVPAPLAPERLATTGELAVLYGAGYPRTPAAITPTEEAL